VEKAQWGVEAGFGRENYETPLPMGFGGGALVTATLP